MPRTYLRRSADVRSGHVVRSTAHDLPRIHSPAAAACCHGKTVCKCTSTGNQPAETGDPRSGTRGAEAGPATTIDAAIARAAGSCSPHRRKYCRLDSAACQHEGVGRSQFLYGIAARRTDAFHVLDAERSGGPNTAHRIRRRHRDRGSTTGTSRSHPYQIASRAAALSCTKHPPQKNARFARADGRIVR